MSSLTKRIARGSGAKHRAGSFHEKGTKLGIPTNKKAKDLLARLEREKKREISSK